MAIQSLQTANKKDYAWALWLAYFTVAYNLAEGAFATWFGAEDEAITLFGFGVDSFAEVISGIGIAHMILRLRHNPDENTDRFEQTALRITGTCFYVLVAGLTASAAYIVLQDHRPETTLWGIVVAVISILVMTILIRLKIRTGERLHSDAIIADAKCTRVCVYMSVVLLVASGAHELTRLPYIDAAGVLGLAWFSFGEGRECFEKAKKMNHRCC